MKGKPFSHVVVIALIAVGVAVFAWAKEERGPGMDFKNRKERMMEERLASLSPSEQALAKALRPLHDSLGKAIHEYARKVRDGAQARSLTSERARILALKAQIAQLEAADPEITMDLLAHLPPPAMTGRGHRPPPPDCPRQGDSAQPPCPRHHLPPGED